MSTDLSISTLKTEGIEEYRQALVRSYTQYEEDFSKEDWPAYIQSVGNSVENEDCEITYVVKDGTKILAGLQIFIGSKKAYHNEALGIDGPIIRYLFVDPSAQGRGIAQVLLNYTYGELTKSGYNELHLHSGRMMTKTMAFYQFLGYIRVPEKDFYIDEYPIYCFKYQFSHNKIVQNN